MAYSSEIKTQVFQDFENNLSVKEISEKYSISLTTLYKWKKEYLEELEDKNICINASKEIRRLIAEKNYEQAIRICFYSYKERKI